MLFEIELNNPYRRLHITAASKEEAKKILDSMSEMSGVNEETEITSFKEVSVPSNFSEPEIKIDVTETEENESELITKDI